MKYVFAIVFILIVKIGKSQSIEYPIAPKKTSN